MTQCLAASNKDMYMDPRHAVGKQYRVLIRAKNPTTYLSGISVVVINGNRSAEVQRRAEKRPLPNPFGGLGVELHQAGSNVNIKISRHDVLQVYATKEAILL